MELYENWTETKETLLEGLSESKKRILGPVLENQMQHLQETAAAGTNSAGAIGNFQKIVIPMIRRIIPGTIATELVVVQPMSGPGGHPICTCSQRNGHSRGGGPEGPKPGR